MVLWSDDERKIEYTIYSEKKQSKMSRKDIAIKGGVIGLVSQVVTLLLKVLVRTFLIRICGRDILGLDGVLLDTISMLSLAELGITASMLYRLYQPVIHGETDRISELLSAYRVIYHVIAILIAAIGLVVSFLLPCIIKDISVSTETVYVSYFMYLLSTVCSYLLSYRRILLNADQKKHLCVLVDLIATVIFSVFKIIVLVCMKSYILYIFIGVVQVITANIYLWGFTRKTYASICFSAKIKKQDVLVLLADTKEILSTKIAGYVYSSTDNLVISIVLGTGLVGTLSNYKYITNALKGLVNNAIASIQPLVGNYLNSGVTTEESYLTLKRYTFFRYIIAGMTTIPLILLSDIAVKIWTNNDTYLMDRGISILLALDYYIGCVYGPINEYITGMGLFKKGKYPMFVGAVSNIVLSLIGVVIYGVKGVLIGTVFSQIVIWVGSAIIIFRYYFVGKNYYIDYIKQHIIYCAIILVNVIIDLPVLQSIRISSEIGKFLLFGIVIECVYIVSVILVYRKKDEYRYAYDILISLKTTLRQRLRR